MCSILQNTGSWQDFLPGDVYTQLDIFGKLLHINFCQAYCCFDLEKFKKSGVIIVEAKFNTDIFSLFAVHSLFCNNI